MLTYIYSSMHDYVVACLDRQILRIIVGGGCSDDMMMSVRVGGGAEGW